jgi:hypothetical protein
MKKKKIFYSINFSIFSSFVFDIEKVYFPIALKALPQPHAKNDKVGITVDPDNKADADIITPVADSTAEVANNNLDGLCFT